MGEVYRAKDTRLDRTVAIKILKGPHSERFEREARAISALNHPHICTLYDVGSHEGQGYLVMEYVEGRPLKGPLPLEEAMRLAVQIAEALDAAHRKGITHRDLKPGNIMVTKSGVKLLDFGLAKLSEPRPSGSGHPALSALPTVSDGLTEKGTILGTLQYMAPEQLEGRPTDARTDIFAFGAVLYEMATGRRAFHRESTLSTLSAILRDEPPPPSEVVPREMQRIILRCLK
ncbi:MAG: serine/threonine protein kinase, partial [Acidobacteria bacterium]|nr:serine/threonine protein kinase [Acidobacteriota bacterium]